MLKMKRPFKLALSIVGVLIMVGAGIALWLFTPEAMIKPNMVRFESAEFVYYYEPQDQSNMEKIARVLDQNHTRITQALGWNPPTKTTVVVYANQKEFQRAARGRVVDLVDVGWFIGDNRSNAVLITTPAAANRFNDANSIIQAAAHEYVHIIEDNINKDLPLYWHEGIAMYLAGQKQNRKITTAVSALPNANALLNTRTNMLTSLEFGNSGGYQLSYLLVEYVVQEFGIESLAAIVRNPSHPEQVFGKDYQTLYAGWLAHIDRNYR
jgi:RNA polymerase sigma-70 factor (ECF subfamily)